MLAKANRLAKESDFKRLALKGRFSFGSLFNLKSLPNKLPISRFGIVISAKVSKKATVRNLIKRRMTEAIRLRLGQLKTGLDIMLVVKKEAVVADYQAIDQELVKLFKKADAWFWYLSEEKSGLKQRFMDKTRC